MDTVLMVVLFCMLFTHYPLALLVFLLYLLFASD